MGGWQPFSATVNLPWISSKFPHHLFEESPCATFVDDAGDLH
jgi:hypothetical protein